MERKEGWIKAEFSRILWAVLAVVLCAIPCLAVDVPAEESWEIGYAINGDWLNVYGTANLLTGAFVDWGIYAWDGSILNIKGGTLGAGYSVNVFSGATVKVYGTDFGGDGDFSVPGQVSFSTGYGILTVTYTDDNGDPIGEPVSLLFLSSIPINLVDTAAGPGPGPTEITIDIKPGSYPNAINLGSNGVIPVAILSTPDLDATTINPETVSLAGLAGVAVRGKGSKLLASEEDVNGDGLPDLVVKIDTENLEPGALQSGSVLVTGTTFEGQDIEGQDDIVIVPPE